MNAFDPALVVALPLATGCFLLGLAVARLRRRRWLAASRSALASVIMLAVGGTALALAFNLYSYQRLTYEQPVAHLRFIELGTQHYRVLITTADGTTRHYDLRGDQWRLEARVLKWRPLANLLGFDASYRLERISGRYQDLAAERERPHTVYALHDAAPGLDVFWAASHVPHWAALVDAEYGSAAYLDMADNAEYEVSLTQSGLIARSNETSGQKPL